MFGQMSSPHGDVGGMGALANGVLSLGGIGLVVAGLMALVAGGVGQTKKPPVDATPPDADVPLPTATVVQHRHPHPP